MNLRLASSLFALFILSLIGNAVSYKLRPVITTLPPACAPYPLGINDAGDVMLTPLINGPGATENSYLVSHGSTVPFGNYGGMFTASFNNLYTVVGSVFNSSTQTYTPQMVDLGGIVTPIVVPGSNQASASSINNLGVVAGTATVGDLSCGFIWTPTKSSILSFPGLDSTGSPFSTRFAGINDLGQVVGNYQGNFETGAFIYQGGSFKTILHGDFNTNLRYNVTGINNLGDVVGYRDTNGSLVGFVYSHENLTVIDYKPYVPSSIGTYHLLYGWTYLNGINNKGQILGVLDAYYVNSAFQSIEILTPFVGEPPHRP